MRCFALLLAHWLAAGSLWGQPVKPLLTGPTEKTVITQGFRDWRGIALSGNTIVAGHQNAQGGLYAFDAATRALKWVFRPAAPSEHVFSRPTVIGETVIAGFSGDKVIAVSLTTGKELWRAAADWPNDRMISSIPASGGLVFVRNRELDAKRLTALDIATGKEKWRVAGISGQPVVSEGKVYATMASPPVKVVALDAQTGQEVWRYATQEGRAERLLASGNAIYAVGDTLVGLDRLTGRELWKPQRLSNQVSGRTENFELMDLVAAGGFVIGVGDTGLVAFNRNTGTRGWDLPVRGTMYQIAAADNVVYFQDRPGGNSDPYILHAIDVSTQKILWSYGRKANAAWAFGNMTPFDGGLWVSGFATLLKLQ